MSEGVLVVGRVSLVVAVGLAVGVLVACSAPPEPEPPREFAARQLAAVGLTVDDFGPGWALLPGEDGSGGGPGEEEGARADDPCAWASAWLPDVGAFATHSWRVYSAGDDATFASDWLAAAAPGADLLAELDAFRSTLSECGTTQYTTADTTGQVTIVPLDNPTLGDAAFSYRADFAGLDGSSWGAGEVHTVVCGPLWLHLSYIGYDPFVERDHLLTTLVERASELGEC